MSKINNLKTIFSRKEQILLREAMAQTEELNKKTRTKSNTKSEKNIEKKSKKTKNSLRGIVDTIITNSIIQKAIGVYDIMKSYNKESSKRVSKIYYKGVLRKLGGNPENLNMEGLRRSIMNYLPPNPNIENILDTNYKIKKIKNKEDRESVINYLSKV